MGTASIRVFACRVAAHAAVVASVSACAASHARAPALDLASGEASYYADHFAGRSTASGEAYDPADFTAAHRTLPFGARIRVTDVTSGRSVVVRVNDRGPWGKGRIIDLSRAAAEKIGLVRRGRAQVTLAPAGDREDAR